ncbi:thiamine-monophosphate kinase [Alicyclobacillus hesperidum]|uniref:Thiamine-monophosphate kinase n=1 Tax=Alicyclobacillus hesperidum TaxID=89784 RepID=A0A1H2UKM4_9BACL|nr:thiamine-phosphate kinase [Alicyclobacillus hesperidum]GLV14388.1 thiamine-monophosphate kinase [Alicyclobacillus hesperidum]SDW56620.1 thiamine-phosphate kinase [Alicyclobacillus hesperidum]
MDEFALIRALLERLPAPRPDVVVASGDDAAVVTPPRGQLVLTTDALVEGVHFLESTITRHNLGYKSLAVSISDIAAMGGEPLWATVTLAVSPSWREAELAELYDGLAEACSEFGCSVVGGDVVSTPGPFTVSIALVGKAERPILRSGARPGDILFVTGWLGGSAAGLDVLQGKHSASPVTQAALARCHQRPTPRIGLGLAAARAGVSALNDVSDGLASELNEIATASGVRCVIAENQLPIRPEVKEHARFAGRSAVDYALYGGEDYELVGAAPHEAFARLLAAANLYNVPVTAIGRCEDGDGVVMRTADGLEVVEAKGYNHFTSR